MSSQTVKLECLTPLCEEFGKLVDHEIDLDTNDAVCLDCLIPRYLTEAEVKEIEQLNETKLQDAFDPHS